MRDFPIDDHLAEMCTRVFRLVTGWKNDSGNPLSCSATGFAVAKLPNGKFVLATAKHVLDVPEDRMVDWVIQQYDGHSRLVREVRYGTHKGLKDDVPYRTHKEFDVGLFPLYNKKLDGTDFVAADEHPLPLIELHLMVSTGTRVGWLGYPDQVEDFVGRPQLCYCEGVVSSMVNKKEQHLYIVDGHGTHGFSGGPVFDWDSDRKRFRVVGIVSKYLTGKELPGFCCFEPINHVRQYLDWWNGQLTDGSMRLA